jgi:hypothetical protein
MTGTVRRFVPRPPDDVLALAGDLVVVLRELTPFEAACFGPGVGDGPVYLIEPPWSARTWARASELKDPNDPNWRPDRERA